MSTTTIPAAASAVPALSPFRMLPLARLKESPLNTRRHFDAKGLEELASSIRQRGVLTPFLVRPSGEGFEIAAGHRRYRAAKIAGNVTEIPAVVREMSDAEFLEVIVIENLQREDVHEMDEANGYKELIKKHKYTVETIAKKVGKSESYIYQRLKLAELIPEVQKLFMDGEITAGHAILIARESTAGQKAIVEGGLYYETWESDDDRLGVVSVRTLGDWIQRELHLDLKKALFDVKSALLVPVAGSCLNCPKRTGGAAGILFPDLAAGSDVCTDRQCYSLKLTAHINAEVVAGQSVRLTTAYDQRNNSGMYYLDDHGRYQYDKGRWARKAFKKCDSTFAGIFVDGQERGKTLDVCIKLSCKLHFPAREASSSSRNQSTPAQRLANAKQSIDIQMDSELRKRICAAAVAKLEAVSSDIVKVAKKPALALVAKLVFDRFDHQVRNRIHEDLRLGGGIDKFVAKLPAPAIQALIVKMVLMNLSMGFTAGFYSRSDAAKDALGEIAGEFGVKTAPIAAAVAALKKEKLAQAAARHAPKVQTSAKKSTAAKKSKKAAA